MNWTEYSDRMAALWPEKNDVSPFGEIMSACYFIVEIEANGLESFIYNPIGDYFSSVKRASILLDLSWLSDVLRNIEQVFPNSKIPADWHDRLTVMERMEERMAGLEVLDAKLEEVFAPFYDNQNMFEEKLSEYIQANYKEIDGLLGFEIVAPVQNKSETKNSNE